MAKNVSRGVGGKEAKEEFDILNRILKTMEEGKDIRAAHWSAAGTADWSGSQYRRERPALSDHSSSARTYRWHVCQAENRGHR